MRNFLTNNVAIISISIVGILVAVFTFVPGTAAEDPDPEVGMLSKDSTSCQVYDGQKVLIQDSGSVEITKIYGPNGSLMKRLLQCSGDVDEGDQGAVIWTSTDNPDVIPEDRPIIYCRIFDQTGVSDITSDWIITVAASGNVKLTCHFEGPHPP